MALLASGTAERLSRFDNFRLVVSESAPLLQHAVAFAARLAPPPALGAVDPCLVAPESCAARADQAGGPSFAGRDVVLVTIDALRADHVSAYGYSRRTTPHIDALAIGGVRFEHAYCATPHTSYSVTSLLTGKFMRPLLLQGIGQDSDTLATVLRTYGYRTAAFYPPAVFFIDEARFTGFAARHFGFEYAKVEFLEGEGRVTQIEGYLRDLPPDQRLFLWVHLFGPHEPYTAHPAHPFGDQDVDRYDSEIADADHTVGAIVDRVRKVRPNAVVIVTADHGEEFGEHGGRYHGTSVYEEQVRVPLVISAPSVLAPRTVREVVQTVDIVPTVLSALSIPRSPRLRGRDLGPVMAGTKAEGPGFASAETDEWTLLAEGPHRLVCARKLGACRVYDLARDPGQRDDVGAASPELLSRLRDRVRAFGGSHGAFETNGVRSETGRGWPGPILRGIAGDADAAPDLAALLDDADPAIRRKATELLFELHRSETLPALRLVLSRDEDPVVKRFAALALSRMGETVPLTLDLLKDPDLTVRRLAALALAENGDSRGEAILVDHWLHGGPEDHGRALDLLGAFAKIRSRDAVWPLMKSLGDVRLRPAIARTLAAIGDDTARGSLALALAEERHQNARIALAEALVALGAEEELARPLTRFLGVPDPLPGGLGFAERAGILKSIGGPEAKGLKALREQGDAGVAVRVVVPKSGNGTGVRIVVRADGGRAGGQVRVGRPVNLPRNDSKGTRSSYRKLPEIHPDYFLSIPIPATAGSGPVEVSATLPPSLGVAPGRQVELVVFAERHVRISSLAVVPLADELPPPPPVPWTESEDARPAGAR